jgi:hypothetical protein
MHEIEKEKCINFPLLEGIKASKSALKVWLLHLKNGAQPYDLFPFNGFSPIKEKHLFLSLNNFRQGNYKEKKRKLSHSVIVYWYSKRTTFGLICIVYIYNTICLEFQVKKLWSSNESLSSQLSSFIRLTLRKKKPSEKHVHTVLMPQCDWRSIIAPTSLQSMTSMSKGLTVNYIWLSITSLFLFYQQKFGFLSCVRDMS